MSSDDPPDPFAHARAHREEARRRREALHRQRHELMRLHEEDRARRSGRQPLDITRIAKVAVAIADARGVDEVSMRKVASALGAGTMSLYHYVRTKEDLLAAMDDLVMAEVLVPPRELAGGWRRATLAIAHHTLDAYRRHPWALTVRTMRRPGLAGLRHVEQSLAALADTGLDFARRMLVLTAVDDFIFGHALRQQQHVVADVDDTALLAQVTDFMATHLCSGDFPELQKLIGDRDPVKVMQQMASLNDPDEWFETGLEALLDGLARRLAIPD